MVRFLRITLVAFLLASILGCSGGKKKEENSEPVKTRLNIQQDSDESDADSKNGSSG